MKDGKIKYFGGVTMDPILAIAIILVVLWLLGFLALPSVGALIHILLVIAIIIILYRLLTGKKIL